MSKSIESQKKDYYKVTRNQPHSRRTERAVGLDQSSEKIAIECGCGAGTEVSYLLMNSYRVHGFDSNIDSIQICQERYADHSEAVFSQKTFEDFEYPDCSLMIAHNSLYFSDRTRFSETWSRMVQSLRPSGVFSGDFLGLNDDWAHGSNVQVNPLSSHEVKRLFDGFDIISQQETNEAGKTALGHRKHWHVYTMIARKHS